VKNISSVTIIGMGLMGGSLAAAIKHKEPGITVTGVDYPKVIEKALSTGIADKGEPIKRISQAAADADLVFLCTPITVILDQLEPVLEACRPGTVVTDMGSTKARIVEKGRSLEQKNGVFIGGHPMTGREKNGIGNIDPLLYENCVYVLTPGPSTETQRVKHLAMLLERIGARVLFMQPGLHDRIAAFVSHMPQLLAVSLANLAGDHSGESSNYLRLAAGGFRDMTRIASSPWEVWQDIIESNTDEIAGAIDQMCEKLQDTKKLLAQNSLRREFENAAQYRLSIPRDTRGFLLPLYDISVSACDRPGVIAALSTALAREQINIKDIQVLKVREGESGVFRLALESEQDRQRSIELLTEAGFTARARV